MRQVKAELGLHNIQPLATRIEAHTGSHDVITSRAFASLSDFVAVGASLLSDRGMMIAMTGKIPHDQIQELKTWQIKALPVNVPNLGDERSVVVLSETKAVG